MVFSFHIAAIYVGPYSGTTNGLILNVIAIPVILLYHLTKNFNILQTGFCSRPDKGGSDGYKPLPRQPRGVLSIRENESMRFFAKTRVEL